MTLSATHIPEGAAQVGIVEARGAAGIDALVPELIQRTREVGGNYAVIDHVQTRFEYFQTLENYQYPCAGPMRPSMYCTGSRPVSNEVMVTRIVARAFRVEVP